MKEKKAYADYGTHQSQNLMRPSQPVSKRENGTIKKMKLYGATWHLQMLACYSLLDAIRRPCKPGEKNLGAQVKQNDCMEKAPFRAPEIFCRSCSSSSPK